MARTADQKAADDALSVAIENVIQAYDEEGELSKFVMVEYVAVVSHTYWNSEGDGITSVATVMKDGDVPAYRIIGLLEHAKTRMLKYVQSDHPEE